MRIHLSSSPETSASLCAHWSVSSQKQYLPRYLPAFADPSRCHRIVHCSRGSLRRIENFLIRIVSIFRILSCICNQTIITIGRCHRIFLNSPMLSENARGFLRYLLLASANSCLKWCSSSSSIGLFALASTIC